MSEDRERFERQADEAERQARRSSDPLERETLLEMARSWRSLADTGRRIRRVIPEAD